MNFILALADGTTSRAALERGYKPLLVYAEAGILALAAASRADP